MQAILLLAHKGYDYIDNFCKQFNNDDRFRIFIHCDKKLKKDNVKIINLKQKYPIIKEFYFKYDCKYFDMSLIDAEIDLLKSAKDNNYSYYHLMSEQCAIITSLDIFYNYFENSNKDVFMEFEQNKEGWQIIDKSLRLDWAGSQWWSLSNTAVDFALNIINTTNYYNMFKEAHYKFNYGKTIRIIAADETFFTNLYKLYDNELTYTNNKRFYDFTWPLVDFCHPHELNVLNIKKYIDDGILFNLIVRKIDYKKSTSELCVKQLLYINRYASSTFIGS